MKKSVITLFVILFFFLVETTVAFTPPTDIVSSRQDGLEINASLNYNAFTGITEIYNFSVTNYNTSSTKWDIPIFIHIEGVEFFEWKAVATNRINSTQNGTQTIEHNHNGTLENHTQPTFLFETVTEEQWKPSKQFLNTAHPKYGKKVNATSTINIGAQSTKYFWARFKTVFGSPKKFDISHLDPFITGTTYKAGTGQLGQGFDTDINKTTSEAINFTANSVTIGIDTTSAVLGITVDENFENNSKVNWNGGAINSTDPINGTFSFNIKTAGIAAIRNTGGVGNNSETNNITFTFSRDSVGVGEWSYFVVFPNNQTAFPATRLSLIQYGGNDNCASASGLWCYENEAGATTSTGLHCNFGNKCNLTIEINATKSGDTADTVFYVYMNGTRAGPFDTRGLTPTKGLYWFGGATVNTGLNQEIDDIKIYNASIAGSSVNATNNGYARSIQFASTTTIRRWAYNSTETGTADALIINVSCNDITGTWSQGTGAYNTSRPPENTFMNCPVIGRTFVWDTNVSQQQDLEELNISLVLNTVPSTNNTLWNQSIGSYTRINLLNATVNVNEPDGENYNVSFNWSRSGTVLRYVNVSNTTGNAERFSDQLNLDTLRKNDVINITTWVQDGQSVDGTSTKTSNETTIADFPVEYFRQPSFNFTQIFGQNNVLVNLTIRDEDPGDNITTMLNFSKANSHNNASNIVESLVNLTTNSSGQINFTFFTGNFSGGDNVSFRVISNSSTSSTSLGNFTSTVADWFIVKTNVNHVNITNVPNNLKIQTSPFEINWTASRDSDASDTNITYRIEYANDGGDDFILLNTSHPETNFTWSFRGTSGLRFNTTYRFRVRSEFGINFTEYNITSNITLGENRTDINASTVTILGNDQIGGRYGYDSNVTIQVNITPGLLTNITSVTFAVFYPNGSVANITENRSLADADTFLWNSTQRIRLNAGGTYRWKINATNDAGNTTTAESTITRNGSFVVDSDYYVNPAQQLLKVIDPADRLILNVSVYHVSPENITFNASVVMENSTAFNTSFQVAILDVNGSVHNQSNPVQFILQVNATANTALRDDEYFGNVTVTRVSDSNKTIIPITFGVNPPSGELTMEQNIQGGNQCNSVTNNCLYTKTLTEDAPDSFTWLINNTGEFNLTGCSAHFYDASTGQNLTLPGLNALLNITNTDETNPINTSVRPNSTATLRIDLGSTKTVGTYTANIDVLCRATRFGFVDAASANPQELPFISITVEPTTGTAGPSAGGGEISLPTKEAEVNVTLPLFVGCGDNICSTEREDIFSCRIDCAPDFDTVFTSVLSGDLFAQSRVTRALAIIVISSLLVVYFRTLPSPSVQRKPKNSGAFT